MHRFDTALPDARIPIRLLRQLLMCIVVCGLALIAVSPAAFGQDVTTSTPARSANGCPAKWADQSYICPAPAEESYPLIEYLYSDLATDAIAIRLTPAGMEYALTCDGAADIGSLVIRHYEQIPREERARDSVTWAEIKMIDEIHAHAQLGEIPRFLDSANPVDIVFPHYEGEYGPDSGAMRNLGQQVVFGTLWKCE